MTRQLLKVYLVVGVSLLTAWLMSMALRDSLIDFARVTNESMLPYLKPGQKLIISKLSPCLRVPFSQRTLSCGACSAGHAYVFRHPTRHGHRLVKFAVSRSEFILGKAHVASGDIISFTPRTGASGEPAETDEFLCYFVGSNDERSVDSRDFGPVAAHDVEGMVIYP